VAGSALFLGSSVLVTAGIIIFVSLAFIIALLPEHHICWETYNIANNATTKVRMMIMTMTRGESPAQQGQNAMLSQYMTTSYSTVLLAYDTYCT
jgi:hypothetical protein